MAITVGIFQQSGGGKSTSIVINPDGTYNLQDYQGMDPKTTVIINSDRKKLPFKGEEWVEGSNVFVTSNSEQIKTYLDKINKGSKIKAAIIDTVNGIMVDKEMLESKKLSYDKWMDLAKDIYELVSICNNLREDLVIYFMGHVTLYTDVDGNESKCLITNGKKLEKIKLESKFPVVLFGAVERGTNGDNKYFFETQANRSTGKTPLGMFDEFKIPNSLKLVDDTVRKYYNIT
jgi:hypothetical protein